MHNELRDQLQRSFGSTFDVREELGGGGMSRVFVAREAALGRDVVIKVLHPDLFGGLAVDRFRREIQLSAQLQHPHIVPLLSAGEIDGLPFLMMPFVDGRSLRERLAEAQQLPLDEAVTVLRDVARALDYAHSRGVIHRDIKPDNVLLSRGAATVTDFGVAKAISAAREEAGATLTSVGTSIGTPTYMAPEQAAGDPNTDSRADIYAWGVMAYELLAGRPPFTHREPQLQLVAHLAETPVPVLEHRPDCPASLADLVMRCLEKDREARPQAAADLVRLLGEAGMSSGGAQGALPTIELATRRTFLIALGAYAAAFLIVGALTQTAIQLIGLPDWVLPGALIVMALGLPVILFTALVHYGSRAAREAALRTPRGGVPANGTMSRLALKASPHFTWRRTALGGVIAICSFATLVGGFMALRALGIGPAASLFAKGVINERDRILVTDFSAPRGDSTLGPVISEAVRTSLAQSKTIDVVPSLLTGAALRRMELPATTRLNLTLARQLAEREGIKAVLDGSVTPVGTSYIITLKLYATADSSELVTHQESAESATDLIAATDRATRRLRERMGESFRSVREAPRLERVTTASLPALRKYTEGWRANTFDANWQKSIEALEEAILLDSTFAIALRQAALVYINSGTRPGRIDTLLQQAFRHRERLPALERALVEGSYYTYSSAADRAQAIAAFERAVDADSTNASALNSLGLAYLHRRQADRAIPVLEQMVRTNPENSFAVGNLTTAFIQVGRDADARRVLAEGIRRFPDNANLYSWQRILWNGDRQRDSARVFCNALVRHQRMNTRAIGTRCLYAIELMEGRLREAGRRAARVTSLGDSLKLPGNAMQATLDSLLVQVLLLDRAPAVATALGRALAAHPLGTDPTGLELRFPAAQLYAMAGRPREARELIADYDRIVTDSVQRRKVHTLRYLALGEIAIAEGRFPEAILAFQRADTLDDGAPQECDVCVLPHLARAYDLAGREDEAIRTFEQFLTSNYAWRRTASDGVFYAAALKRLGELYEAKGNHEKASSYYARFIDLWQRADSELQPWVEAARRRLTRLDSRRG